MKAYILTLLAAALIVTVCSVMLPEGSVKKYAKLVSSVIISLSVITPLKGLLNIDGEFLFEEISSYEMRKEKAEEIYNENLKNELKNSIEEKLSEYGRAYVTISENLNVKTVEIYAEREISEEERKNIEELYAPERLEIIYGEE